MEEDDVESATPAESQKLLQKSVRNSFDEVIYFT